MPSKLPSGWHAFHHLRVTPTLNPVDEILKMQREALEALDRIDPLAPLRDKFLLPPGVIYLVGNSLGALPRSTAARVSQVIEKEWGEDLITSWNRHDWIAMPQRVGDKIARLIGADAGEVVVAESTSINLFKVLAAALKMRPGRRVILSVVLGQRPGSRLSPLEMNGRLEMTVGMPTASGAA